MPTTAEAGLPGFVASAWFGLVATAGTPDHAVRRLNTEVVRALSASEVRATIAKLGLKPAASTPEEFAALITEENTRRAKTRLNTRARP